MNVVVIPCYNVERQIESVIFQSPDSVDKIYWPGKEDSKNYIVAKKQMKYFGGMLSFNLKNDSFEDALKIISNTKC